MPRTCNREVSQLACHTRALRDELLDCLRRTDGQRVWGGLFHRYRDQTGVQELHGFAEAYAQAVACGTFATRAIGPSVLFPRAIDWLVGQADPLVQRVLCDCGLADGCSDRACQLPAVARIHEFLTVARVEQLSAALDGEDGEGAALTYFYEQFLQAYDRQHRRRRGVYYTPRGVAEFIVRSVDDALRSEFQLAWGLADTATWAQVTAGAAQAEAATGEISQRPFVRILDPAMGTGAFLLAVAERCRRTVQGPLSPRASDSTSVDHWNSFVDDHLLPRLLGLEVMLPPVVLAQIQLTALLAQSGYRFERTGRLQLFLADTLSSPSVLEQRMGTSPLPVTVVVGNPPFSGVSGNRQPWLHALMRGQGPCGGREAANYFRIDDRELGERKHWLEDDYVKFMRFAHWQIESAGAGIMGLVTNHGFLDNPTFRGMRQQLLRTFPRVSFVDLHGNKKKGERAPDGSCDQGVFSIEQGVAVSLLRRLPAGAEDPIVEHTDLWGERASKLATLQQSTCRQLERTPIVPESPFYFFVPRDETGAREYAIGWSLVDVMPVHSTAAVTARDRFVTAFEKADLQRRLAAFRDLSISDADVRARYFNNTRSTSYAPGDTRGWHLADARRRLAEEAEWERHLTQCQYRPFDLRWIYWVDWMIDWPRNEVMRHLRSPGNLALIARRQMPASQPCNFFWVTDTLALDGLIRSDNRGSESVFPLYLHSDAGERGARSVGGSRQQALPGAANFAASFIEACCRCAGCSWVEAGRGDLRSTIGPQDLVHYIYALFHAPIYRQRFEPWLRIDFPRVFLPSSSALFRSMAGLGAELVGAHLLHLSGPTPAQYDGPATPVVQAGYPRFEDGAVRLNRGAAFESVRSDVWQLRIGTHQVCRKWLKDRRGRALRAEDIQRYGQILAAIRKTIDVMREIDQQIAAHGGWSQFQGARHG